MFIQAVHNHGSAVYVAAFSAVIMHLYFVCLILLLNKYLEKPFFHYFQVNTDEGLVSSFILVFLFCSVSVD
jgi:Kef-type K+ transport system membrane component KefB